MVLRVVHKTRRTCSKGHVYYKTSDCPTCPVCEKKRKPEDNFLSLLSAPARRALESKGIASPQRLSKYSEKDILALHGIGPSSMPVLKRLLKEHGLAFNKQV